MKVHFGVDGGTAALERTIASLGNYDGVHLGHQAVLQKTVEQARRLFLPSVAVTFDPVPKKILYPETAPPLIQTVEQRLRKLELLGLDHSIVVAFDHHLADKSPEDFVREYLTGILRIKGFVVGQNFSFGHQKKGNLSLLAKMGMELDFFVEAVPEIQVDGARISSSLIREMIRQGKMEKARHYLGSPFAVIGSVVEGERLGGRLGIPTANLDVENELLPARGVYITLALLPSGSHPSVTNVGMRPTFGGQKLTVEAHLIDFSGDLYGQRMELQFLRKLRDEARFSNADELKAHILADIEAAKQHLRRADA